ncbi:hypothetical protein [Natronosalvus caseinilyticus]|uniref:hypothetical protein n=1 Tax=Natronosalvus caseinilyticus TaxID=2953747 RepID=UPI0028ACE885|nr:hypothetical protein [Natronosalvus caseinilyticus]
MKQYILASVTMLVAGLLVTGLVASAGGLAAANSQTTELNEDDPVVEPTHPYASGYADSLFTTNQPHTSEEEQTTLATEQTHTNDGDDIESATVVTEEGEIPIEQALASTDDNTREAIVIESNTVGNETQTNVYALDDQSAESVWSMLVEDESETSQSELLAISEAIDETAAEDRSVTAGANDDASIMTDHGTEVTVEQVAVDRNEQNGSASATGQDASAVVTQSNEQVTEQRAEVLVTAEKASVLVVQLNVQESSQTGNAAAAGENASALVEQTNDQRAVQTANVSVIADDAVVVVAQLNVQVSEQHARAAAAGPGATADATQESNQHSDQSVDVFTSTDDAAVYVTQENVQISEQTEHVTTSDGVDDGDDKDDDKNGDKDDDEDTRKCGDPKPPKKKGTSSR